MAVKEPEKSAYELLRDEKIKANAAKLEELGLGKATLLPEPKAKRAKRKRPEASESAPPRRSSRLRQEAAPEVYVEEERGDGTFAVGGSAAATVARSPDVDALPVDADDLTETERDAYEHLRAVRNAKARAMERSMFIVANDRTLAEMVRTLPASLGDLSGVYGMGAKKLAAHGAMLLYALELHRARLVAHHADLRRAKAPVGE